MSGEIDNGGEGFKMPSLPSVAPPPAKPVPQIPADNFEKPSKMTVKNEENDKSDESIILKLPSHKSPAELLKDRSEPPLQYSEPSSFIAMFLKRCLSSNFRSVESVLKR